MIFPLLGMGTWGMGGKYERDERNADESVEILSYGFDLGLTLVDVAELYGAGLTETIVGRSLKGRRREDIRIVTKVYKNHLHFDDVLRAAEGSLTRLNTAYIDLYIIHWPNPDVPLQETMRALEALVERGLVRAIGVSNFSVPLLTDALSHLKNTTLSANEIEYNLSSRDAEKEVLQFCKKNNIHVIASRPFAKGALLSGVYDAMSTLAAKYGKTPAQIALNWIIRQNITAIPKTGSKEHLRENAGAVGWSLTEKDAQLLQNAYS